MTHETYNNLTRVLDRRISQGRKAGNWKAVKEAIFEKQRLNTEYTQEQKKQNIALINHELD